MDESKFSLNKAAEIIKPYVEFLSFRKFRDFRDGEKWTETIDGKKRSLELWKGHIMVPITLESNDLLYPIEIDTQFDRHPGSKILRTIVKRELFIQYSLVGGKCINWYWRENTFLPWRAQQYVFHSIRSEMKAIRRDDLAEEIPLADDYAMHFWARVTEWVRNSAEIRKKSLDALEFLRLDVERAKSDAHEQVRLELTASRAD